MYQYDAGRYNNIMRLYAEFLAVGNKNREAAIAYEYLGDYANAWPCYRSANLWREALTTATLADLRKEELEDLATTLAEGLSEVKDYRSAATITLEYLNDLPSAVRLLCRGAYFSEAIRLVTLRKQPELIEEVIDQGLVERSGEMTEFLADMKGQLGAQVPRLQELRIKKTEDPLAFYEGTEDTNIPDNVSLAPTDTTSGGTFMTRYTKATTGTLDSRTSRKTSKNKRREERKRARGKKGTVYEEEYLINSIERLIERMNDTQAEIQRLVEGLARRGMRERAVAVEAAVADVVDRCKDAVKETYSLTPEGVTGSSTEKRPANGAMSEHELKPVGGDATLWDSLAEVGKPRSAPVVKAFEKLGLLS